MTVQSMLRRPGSGWVERLLDSPLRGLADKHLCRLHYVGRRSGQPHGLVVGYVETATVFVVVAGHGAAKQWWRNFVEPRPAVLVVRGTEVPVTGRVVGGAEREDAVRAYQAVKRRLAVAPDDPVVVFAREPGVAAGEQVVHARRQWVAATTVGELLGFIAPALMGAIVGHAAAPVAWGALVGAGVVEGAVLGACQAVVLARAVPGVRRRAWIVATASGAGIAWFIGIAPSSLHGLWSGWPAAVVAVAAAACGMALLCALGVMQWLVLRGHLARAGRWIPATALGWCLGLLVFTAIATPLWHEGQSTAGIVAVGVAAAVAMAAVVGVVTSRLLPAAAPR